MQITSPITWHWPLGGDPSDGGRKWWAVLLTSTTLFYSYVDIGHLLHNSAWIGVGLTLFCLVCVYAGTFAQFKNLDDFNSDCATTWNQPYRSVGVNVGGEEPAFESFLSLFSVFSYVMYAFAIVVTLPTLRSTMQDRSQLTPMCIIAFTVVSMEFLVIMFAYYWVFGNLGPENIIDGMRNGRDELLPGWWATVDPWGVGHPSWLGQALGWGITLHLLCSDAIYVPVPDRLACRVHEGFCLRNAWEKVASRRACATGGAQPALVDWPASMTRINSFAAVCADGVTEVRSKNANLRAFMKTLPWPRLVCFEANGRVYDLPLPAANIRSTDTASLDAVADSTLRYLAGFFDGDGCVSCKLSGCFLQVSQSFDQAEILMLLRDTFGGSIRHQRNGLGLQKPTVRWVVCGQSARRAAELLAPFSITKRKQLLLAAEWPEERSHREDCKAELRALKECDSAVAGPCSWEYCAGFFDAEGHIAQPKAGASLALHVAQKHPKVLNCLRDFLAGSIDIDAKVSLARQRPSMHLLLLTSLLDCKQMLRCMLQAGLLCKAKRAELALGLTPENASLVNAELTCLTGNQMYGKKMDASGRDRAKALTVLREQARKMARCQELHKAEAILRKAEALQLEHELSKALHENAQLLKFCRGIEYLHDICWEGSHVHSRPESSELSFQTLGHAWHPICIVIVIALHYNSFKVSGTSNPEHAGRYPYSLHPKKPSEDTAPAMNYRALG
ncbi:unnamed protein product [Symbiodinium sp. KB8]|nr:unnamed protein product [Symbiodinium sp. KB8]